MCIRDSLDSDTLVLGSLKELWDTNLNQLALGGVQDTLSSNPSCFERLQYAPSYNYMNRGVLLLNLAYWRKHNIEQQCICLLYTSGAEAVICIITENEKVFIGKTYLLNDLSLIHI